MYRFVAELVDEWRVSGEPGRGGAEERSTGRDTCVAGAKNSSGGKRSC